MILRDDLIEDRRRCLQIVTMTCETPRSTGSLTRVTTTIRNGLQIEASVTNGGSVVTNKKTTNPKRQVKVVKSEQLEKVKRKLGVQPATRKKESFFAEGTKKMNGKNFFLGLDQNPRWTM